MPGKVQTWEEDASADDEVFTVEAALQELQAVDLDLDDLPEDFWEDYENGAYDDFDFNNAEDDDDYFEEGEEEEKKADDDEVDPSVKAVAGKKFNYEEYDQHALDSVSEVSNEVEVEDFDIDFPDIERNTAQVIPDQPGLGLLYCARKLVLSCLLPLLLAGLVLYAVFKGVKFFLQFLFDIWIISKYLALLMIRIVLFPFYLLFKLFVPKFIQVIVYEVYDQRIGRRVRVVLKIKQQGEDFITDMPNILFACFWAASETCFAPLWSCCQRLCLATLGKYFWFKVIVPVQDARINNVILQKKRHAMKDSEYLDPGVVSQTHLVASRLKRAQVKASKEKARRLRIRRREEGLHIALHLPLGKNYQHAQLMKQFEETDKTKIHSRTMSIERRYAVGVGAVWTMLGMGALILTLDGAENEQCTICEDHPEVGMKMCRHGQGQDCVFVYHSREVIIAIAITTIGLLLLVYSMFLYRPASLGDSARDEELEQGHQEMVDEVMRLKKQEDPDLQALNLVEDYYARNSLGMILRTIWRKSLCGSIQAEIEMIARRCLTRLLKYEERKRLRKRSIAIQERLAAIGHAITIRALRRFARCVLCFKGRKKRKKRKSSFQEEERTPGLSRFFVCRAFCYWIGVTKSTERDGDRKKRVGGVRAAGNTIEEVIEKFGLMSHDVAAEDDPGAKFDALDEAKRAGLEEIQMDVGQDGFDEDVLEEEPELNDTDRNFWPDLNDDPDDLN